MAVAANQPAQAEVKAPAAPAQPRKGMRLFLIILVVGVLLGAVGIGGYKWWPSLTKPKQSAGPRIRTIPVDSITVNIGAGYLKITTGLETTSEEFVTAIADKDMGRGLMMQIKALLTEKLGGLQLQDIDTQEKINGLKADIAGYINEMLAQYKGVGCIDKVIFVEFIYTH